MTSSAAANLWQIWIDTGGTFTDCLAVDPAGDLHRAKVLSTGELRGRIVRAIDARRLLIDQNWDACDDFIAGFHLRLADTSGALATVGGFDSAGSIITLSEPLSHPPPPGSAFVVQGAEEAPVLAARLVTRTPAGQSLPPLAMRLGTTRATNALLERRGRPTALFITRGFGDLLLIGDQQRPDLFALTIRKPPPLYEVAIEVDERLAADGSVLRAFDPASVRSAAAGALARGVTSAAIAFMHSYRNPAHEQQLAGLLRELGFELVTCSSDMAPLMRIVPRAQTAVVNAYLAPVVAGYLRNVRSSLGEARLHVMTSAGGLIDSARVHAKDMVLSGPAGGVCGAATAGRRAGFSRVIGFDMGGTSTDVVRFDGDYEYAFEHHVAGVRVVAPALAIETVAAGGGSICECDERGPRVGPRSAGADPGPACYGSGGPLTLTDVNLLLGRLDEGRFEIPIFVARARAALDQVCKSMAARAGGRVDPDAVLEGFLEIANERMAEAIAQVSLRRGYDPAEYALVAFGGAGGQHAAALAMKLGIRAIIMPADASLLSALGLGHASIERFARRQVLQTLDEICDELEAWFAELAESAAGEVEHEGVPREEIIVRRRIAHLRLKGQDHALTVEAAEVADLRAGFIDAYRSVYGHEPPAERAIEVESISVVASSAAAAEPAPAAPPALHEAQARRSVRARFDRRWINVPAFDRDQLDPGSQLRGPALILDRRSTYVIERGWHATVDGDRSIIAVADQRSGGVGVASTGGSPDLARDLVTGELFASRFMAIAEEMGQMLQRTALSTNVKERLDFSCAILDGSGELLANAPHMPVHLGSMGMCVRAVREVIEMRPQDVIITNHPGFGGSHLPDITIISPVFMPQSGASDPGEPRLLGYVASRAHHAEIGGTRPGSMPPAATSLAEEGVVIAPMRLVDGGKAHFDRLESLLRAGPHPSRAVADNLADVSAQMAANVRGRTALLALADRHGFEAVTAQMELLKERSGQAAAEALRTLRQGRHEAVEYLDDGSPLRVRIDVADGRAAIDFAGSSAQHPGNLNATPAIVRSAVIYVLRLLVGQSLPLNEGLMRVVSAHVPPGLLNPAFPEDPSECPAVAGGNTETSQRLVDTLLKALGVAGCSQGTMNNTLWGNETFAYYETVCGGSGATATGDGADVVQTHMTNTRITDPEVLEHRYPVRLEQFAIRADSGGRGEHRGGNGAVREVTFLAPMELSILSQHREQSPYGAHDGAEGERGSQQVTRANGEIAKLRGVDGCSVGPGDRLTVMTPGGGGYGRAKG